MMTVPLRTRLPCLARSNTTTPTANKTAKAIASRSTCAMPTMACRTASATAAQRMRMDHEAPTLPFPASGGGKRLADGGREISALFTAVARGQFSERVGRNLVRVGDGDPSGGQRAQGRGPGSAFEQGPFAQDGARSNLGQDFSVDVHREDTVEQQEQFVASLTLLDKSLAALEVPDLGFGAATHDGLGQLPFERGLDLGHKGGRILGAPRCALAEDVAGPALEIRDRNFICKSEG